MKRIIKIGILSAIAAVTFTGCGEVARGSKIGQVVKVNEASGLICKTVEVEIIRGGFNSGSGAQGGSLHFTIENNPKNVELVKKAMLDGSEIEVNYRQEFATFCRSDSNGTFADDVKVVKSETSNASTTDVKDEILKVLMLQNTALQKLINR